MKISQSKIDEIATSLDIVDIISQYTTLRKAGKNFMGRCPFHEERTPSFSVSQEKGVYHCFGCGKSGNMFNFIMDIDNVSFYEAVKILADRANVKIEFDEESYAEDKNQIELLYEINKRAAKYFHDNLNSHDGIYAREYLEKREVKEDTIIKFGLGFALRYNDALYNKFINEFKREDLVSSGLILALNLNEYRDRFRGRLIFPVITESSRVVGFGARRLYEDDNLEAKYINSPETKVYNKSKILFGLNFSKNAIKEKGYALLVEGYMDLIMLYQSGIENVIASSGTSLTTLQVKILSRYTDEIVIVYDADTAGQSAARRGIELVMENDMKASVVVLPQGEDPDSYIREYGIDKFKSLLEKRKSFINYLGDKFIQENRLSTPDGKTEFVREIIQLIAKLKDGIKRDFYIKDIAERFSIYESVIRQELERLLKLNRRGLTKEVKNYTSEPETGPRAELNVNSTELMLIRLLTDADTETKEFLMDNLEIDYIINPDVVKIVNYVFLNMNDPKKINYVGLFNEFEQKGIRDILGKALLDENYVIQDKDKNRMNDAKLVLNQLKLSNIKKKIAVLENNMKAVNTYSQEALDLQPKLEELIREKISLENQLKSKKV
ncbi:MAG: DNA primase [Ignavibacteria bacterium]